MTVCSKLHIKASVLSMELVAMLEVDWNLTNISFMILNVGNCLFRFVNFLEVDCCCRIL